MNLRQPETIEDLLLYRLSRLLALGGAPVIRLCEGRLGITWREWRVIASLLPGVSMLSSELAAHTQLDRARTSRCITSLLAKGLIDRRGVATDMRKATVSLTQSGREIYESFFPVVVQLNASLLETLDAGEVQALDRALTAIGVQAGKLSDMADLPKANRRRGGRPGGTDKPQRPAATMPRLV